MVQKLTAIDLKKKLKKKTKPKTRRDKRKKNKRDGNPFLDSERQARSSESGYVKIPEARSLSTPSFFPSKRTGGKKKSFIFALARWGVNGGQGGKQKIRNARNDVKRMENEAPERKNKGKKNRRRENEKRPNSEK